MREIKRRRIEGIPFDEKEKIEKFTGMSLNTLRNWRANKKNLQLFYKIGGRVFLNVREWQKFEIKATQEAKNEAIPSAANKLRYRRLLKNEHGDIC